MKVGNAYFQLETMQCQLSSLFKRHAFDTNHPPAMEHLKFSKEGIGVY